jgi:DNA-directed RNA polymerase subunit H (RpoH/RPB5)
MEAYTADIIIRSRQTILDILEERGYYTMPYRNIAGDQILTLAEGHSRALDIVVKKRPDSEAPCERAVVIYSIQDRTRSRLDTTLRSFYMEPSASLTGNAVSKKDDLIVILNEPYHEVFDKAAAAAWQNERSRLTFFHIKQLVVHPGRHVLVPPHRKLSLEEARAELERLHIGTRSQLPLIKHHDIQARVLGLVPGDIIEVLRPSPTAGVARILRVCAA